MIGCGACAESDSDRVRSQPVNYLTHLKLADVLYSLDDVPLARKYYAQSLELNREANPRAAIGMVLCTSGRLVRVLRLARAARRQLPDVRVAC